MTCSMMCVDYWLILLSSLLVWSWGVCYEIPNLTIFDSSISYIGFFFQSLWENWSVLNDFFLMMSCCDMFDLIILESLINIILGYFLVACWELMDIVIYHLMLFSCLWITDVIIVDYLLMLSSHLWMTEVNLLWFFDLWLHELRVGNLYVVSGSSLQWGPRP